MLDLGNLPVPHEDGSFVNERVGRIAELLQDYDKNIEVRWIPPAQRGNNEPAFAIVNSTPNQQEYVMFYVQDENEFDGSVIERVFQMDAAKHGNILSKVDAHNLAIRATLAKKKQEELDEAHDLATSILRSKKHTYRHNGMTFE